MKDRLMVNHQAKKWKRAKAHSKIRALLASLHLLALLFTTRLHARKMTALVQSATGSEHPVLLLYDTKAGHSGGMPVSKQIEDEANELQFLFWQLGVKM